MIFFLLAGLSIVVPVLLVRRRLTVDAAAIRPSLILGGVVYLVGWLIQVGLWRAGRSPLTDRVSLHQILAFQSVLLAGLALVLWSALCRLVLYRFQRRDLALLIPFTTFSIFLGVVPRIHPLTAALLALPALARLRWRREIGPETLALTSVFGTLFVLLNFSGLRLQADPGLRDPVLLGLQRYSDWVRSLAAMHVLLALPRLLWGLNLPVRSVKRRLLVSHLLTGVVPLLLVGIFWGLSTFLSVNGERAQIAARHLTEGASEFGAKLDAGLRAPDPLTRIREWGSLEATTYPGLTLFLATPRPLSETAPPGIGSLTRVVGDSVPGEEALASWPDSVDSQGVVLLRGMTYLGAVRRAAGSKHGAPIAALLVPMPSILNRSLERKVDASTFLQVSWHATTLGLNAPGLRGRGAGAPGGGDSTAGISETGNLPGIEASAGAAVVPAMEWTGDGWRPQMVLLWARVGFFHAIRGLALNLSENPFNLIPLVFLGVVALLFFLVEVLTLGMVTAMGSSILRSLSALRQGTARLRSGNLRYRIPIEGNDDLWTVAESFNDMTADLEKARELEIEKERLEGELHVARRIQARLLPGEAPIVPRTDLAGHSSPAFQVGGDYYDFLPLGGGRIGIIVADVSGKGVPAALLMSSFRAALHSQHLEEGPGHTFEHLNTFLHRSVEPGRFVTAFLALLDPATGKVTYVNAGHNPPVVLRPTGEVVLLQEGGLVLGLFEHSRYKEGHIQLTAGDLLVLFTDGVTEATNEDEDFWGEERLLDLLRRQKGESCRRILRSILEEVHAFSGDQRQSDDITLVLARWRGGELRVGEMAEEVMLAAALPG